MGDEARQCTVAALVIPEIVTFPAEVDISNAYDLGGHLEKALRPGVRVLIADLAVTQFIDSRAVHALLIARDSAAAHNAELRLVISHPTVLRILNVMGLDRILQIYPTLTTALAAGQPPAPGG